MAEPNPEPVNNDPYLAYLESEIGNCVERDAVRAHIVDETLPLAVTGFGFTSIGMLIDVIYENQAHLEQGIGRGALLIGGGFIVGAIGHGIRTMVSQR